MHKIINMTKPDNNYWLQLLLVVTSVKFNLTSCNQVDNQTDSDTYVMGHTAAMWTIKLIVNFWSCLRDVHLLYFKY